MQFISVFLDIPNLVISSEKMLMSAELNGCIPLFIYFLDLLLVRYKCAKFHHCSICMKDFREEGLSAPYPPPPRPPRHP